MWGEESVRKCDLEQFVLLLYVIEKGIHEKNGGGDQEYTGERAMAEGGKSSLFARNPQEVPGELS